MAGRKRQGSRHRRGAIAAALAVAATAMLGMAALATEGGVWLLARRNAQNAADAAAHGGMQVLAMRPPLRTIQQAESAATEIAGLNGFMADARTTIVARAGMWNTTTRSFTAGGATPNAMLVEITQIQSSGLARLISSAVPAAWGGAVATQILTAPACVLSIPPPGGGTAQVDGTIDITGSTAVNAANCALASNGPDIRGARSIDIGQNQTGMVTAGLLYAAGTCNRCDEIPAANLPNGYLGNQPPLPNPYAELDDRALNPMDGFVCTPPVYRGARGEVMPSDRGRPPRNWVTMEPLGRTPNTPPGAIPAICEDISPGNGQSVNFTAGATYYFHGASLTLSGGGSVIGRGVTLVFTGGHANDVGTVRITGGTVDLVAPAAGVPSVYDGIVIYRDVLATPRNSDKIEITGNADSTLFGGIYAPTTEVRIQGNTNANPPPGAGAGGCTAIVAGAVTFSGNSTVSINACGATNTEVARLLSTILVQ